MASIRSQGTGRRRDKGVERGGEAALRGLPLFVLRECCRALEYRRGAGM